MPCKIEVVPYFLYTRVTNKAMDFDVLSNNILDSIFHTLVHIIQSKHKNKVGGRSFVNAMNPQHKRKIIRHLREHAHIRANREFNSHSTYVFDEKYLKDADFSFFYSLDIHELKFILENSQKVYVFIPSNRKRFFFRSVINMLKSVSQNGLNLYDYGIKGLGKNSDNHDKK